MYQPDTGHNVCHVAFVSRRNDVVLPGSQLRFGQGVLTLAMQRKELELFVKPFVVDAGNITPRKGPAFGRSEVFNGMEGERGEIGDFAADPARTNCRKPSAGSSFLRMPPTLSEQNVRAEGFLQFVRGAE